MSEQSISPTPGLALSEAIGLLRDQLVEALAATAASPIQLPVESMTVELSVIATRSVDGRAGFMVPIAGMDLVGESSERLLEQKVTIVFGRLLDRDGYSVKVASPAESGIEEWDRS